MLQDVIVKKEEKNVSVMLCVTPGVHQATVFLRQYKHGGRHVNILHI